MSVMHLEISGRMTGKTTRMVEWAKKQAKAGVKVTIVLGTGWRDCIRQFRAQNDIASREISVILDSQIPLDDRLNSGVWCFDEFDWYKKTCPIISNGYYCTTAQSLRDMAADPQGDPLLELIKLNGGYQSVPLLVAPHINPADFKGMGPPELTAILNGQVFKMETA